MLCSKLTPRSSGTNSNVADLFDQLGSAIGSFNLFDWVIVLVWLVSSGYGIARGFAREALSIIGWVSAFLLANVMADSVAAAQPRVATPSEEPLVDDQGLAIFYVLQIATVGSASRADELVEALQALGYKAFSNPYVRVDDELFRVQIGPNAERTPLMRIKPEIDAVLEVDSQILRYEQ